MKINHESFFKLLVIFNLFFPTFNSILDRTGGVGVLFINAVLLFCVIIQLAMLYVRYKMHFTRIELVYFIVFAVYALNILVTSFFNTNVIFSDVFELFRPVFYFSNFLLGFNLIRLRIISPQKIIEFLSLAILLTACFSLTCIIFFDSFGRDLIGLYAKDTLIPGRRFTGTFQNPYDFSFIGVLPFSFYLYRFIVKGSIFSFFSICVLLLTIAFGQSKSGFGTMLMIVGMQVVLIPFFVKTSELKRNVWLVIRYICVPVVFVLSFIVFVTMYSEQFSYLINGLSRLFNGGDRSSQIRLEQFNLVLNMLDVSFFNVVLGFGSLKNSGLLFESLYSLYLFRYGAFSFIYLFFWVLLPITMILFFRKSFLLSNECKLLLLCLFVAVIPAGVGNNVIDQSRIPFLYFTILGLVLGSLKIATRGEGGGKCQIQN